MNKNRLAQAIAAAGILTSATSATAVTLAEGKLDDNSRWAFDVTGWYIGTVAYARGSGAGLGTQDFDGLDTSTNAELQFQPRIELDNGLTIGANIELEGEQSGADQIDESYLYIEGEQGRLVMGSDNSVGYNMHLTAPTAINMIQPGDQHSPEVPVSFADFIPITSGFDSVYRGTLGTTKLENNRNNDAKRISYYSPDYAGLTYGFSYAHDPAQDNFGPTNCSSTSGQTCNIIDTAVRYEMDTDGVGIKASARYGRADLNTLNPTVMGVGLHVSVGNITVGGSYAKQDDLAVDNGSAFDFGVVMAQPESGWSYSFNYFSGENDEAAGTDELNYLLLGANYDYNQYISYNAFLLAGETEAAAANSDRDGEAAGASVIIKF